jgi:hypothetical protein
MRSRSISRSVSPISSITFGIAALLAVGCGEQVSASASIAEDQFPYADIVMMNGVIHTMDTDQPIASALAIRGQEIVVVGDEKDVVDLVGPDTQVVQLDGRGVTPGLVDGHAHLAGLGRLETEVDLRGSKSAQEAAQRVAEYAATLPEGAWATGRGWDQNLWEVKEFPHHRVLDEVLPDRPVAVRRVDGHGVWLNAAAMKAAGITRDTAAPEGGQIIKDNAGEPTGVLVDAGSLYRSAMPPTSVEEWRRHIIKGAQIAVSLGMTGVHVMGVDDNSINTYVELAATGELLLRVTGYLSLSAHHADRLAPRKLLTDDGAALFSLRGVKMYADGALGSRGARLQKPYSDRAGHSGEWQSKPEDIREAVKLATDAGWQVAIHAIGDAAIHEVLGAYETAIEKHAGKDLRLRVEHAQVVALDDIPRFGKHDIIASMQPTHCTSDMPWAPDRVGEERIKGAYAWKKITEAGGVLVAGSDFPVEKPAPLLGLYAAVTRQQPDGTPEGGWAPDQRMTLTEAIEAFTVAPAYAAFVEDHRGMLRAGYVADVTVYDQALSGDDSLLERIVDMTVVGGQVVYTRK